MLDSVFSALMRVVSNELNDAPPAHEAEKAMAALNSLESTPKRDMRIDNLGIIENQAHLPPPSMWN
jgi:hypothetical protein